MFGIFSRQKQLSIPPGWFRTDMHSHVLPGIDDGAPDVAASLALIGQMVSLGYTRIITTPHVYEGYYPNTQESIAAAYENIRQEVSEKFPGLVFSYGAEYFMGEQFRSLVASREILPISGNRVLVEQGFFAETPGLDEILFSMQTQGYLPVLAHPERYGYYHARLRRLEQIRERGIAFQVNLLSLSGRYGPEVRKQAEILLARGWVDYAGTDAHKLPHIDGIRAMKLSDQVLKKIEACRNEEL